MACSLTTYRVLVTSNYVRRLDKQLPPASQAQANHDHGTLGMPHSPVMQQPLHSACNDSEWLYAEASDALMIWTLEALVIDFCPRSLAASVLPSEWSLYMKRANRGRRVSAWSCSLVRQLLLCHHCMIVQSRLGGY